MKKHLIIIILVCYAIKCAAQTGTFNYEFTPLNGGPSVKKSIAIPLVKYSNYNTYWFVNPNTGARHLMVNGSLDIGIIILDDRADTNVVYRDSYRGDQFNILGENTATKFYIRPDNDHRPIRIHYNTFNAGEIYFTFAGNAVYEVPGPTGGTTTKVHGIISGTFQAFREPKYEQTDKMPGCNCDPTIYAKYYDEETGRTPSACENALLWKVFNHVQKALNNLVPNIANREESGVKTPGAIIYRETGATIDVTGPLSTVDPCNPTNERRAVVSVNAATRPFTQDTYGLSFFKLPDFENGPLNTQSFSKRIGTLNDSTSRLLKAGKITALQQQKIMVEALQQASTGMPDMKLIEMEGSVKIKLVINTIYGEASAGVTGEDYRPVVRHTIPGSSFDIYIPAHKNEDGYWMPNKDYIYYGKFNIVNSGLANGNGIKSITPVYAPNVNKLTVFNIMVMVEGGNDLIQKVLANVDLKNIQQLIDTPKTK